MKFKLINVNKYIHTHTKLDPYYCTLDNLFDNRYVNNLIDFDYFNIRYNEI